MQATQTLRRLFMPRPVAFGASIFLLIYVGYHEREIEQFSGCWDCGWETRQAVYLMVAALALVPGKLWSAIVSVVASVQVVVSVGLVAFAENIAEVKGVWPILRTSVKWSLAGHPEFFVEIALALGIGVSSGWLIWRVISARIHQRGSDKRLDPKGFGGKDVSGLIS
jgi:hypothetical protein